MEEQNNLVLYPDIDKAICDSIDLATQELFWDFANPQSGRTIREKSYHLADFIKSATAAREWKKFHFFGPASVLGLAYLGFTKTNEKKSTAPFTSAFYNETFYEAPWTDSILIVGSCECWKNPQERLKFVLLNSL